MSPARVSILLPFRNGEATLEECLDSIQEQTFTEFELLAVNDRSDDRSLSIIRTRAESDKRIRILENPGCGLVSALNYGLANSSAEYIARMDVDDRMHPQRLQRQLDFMQQHPDITLVASQARLFPEEMIQDGFREYMRWQNSCLSPQQIADEIYVESPMVHPTVFFRRRPVMQLGGYREGLFPEDYDLWLRLHAAGHRMAKLDAVLLDWREDPQRTSRTDPRCSREAFDALRARHLAADARFVARRDDFVIWGAGRKTRRRCDHLLERGFSPQAWIDIDPNKIGNRLNGVPVVAPEWLEREPKPFVLGYVANHGARDLIAEQLQRMGYERGTDYLMVG